MDIIVDIEERLDKFLLKHLNESRNQITNFIKNGYVKVNNKIIKKAGCKLKQNDTIALITPTTKTTLTTYPINFNIDIIYEDSDLLVINKPSSITVHPAPSVKEATVVDWLKFKGISLSTISGEERHGIVHRLDKGTSGVMVVAKNNNSHKFLSAQLQDKSMGRIYLAIINQPLKNDVTVNKPIARNPKNRLKMGIVEGGKEAKTFFKKLLLSKDEKKELILAKLYTGRTHQIRVHLKSISRYILGDDLYGFKSNNDRIGRILLHAYCLYLIHPKTKKKLYFFADMDECFKNFLKENFDKGVQNEVVSKEYISSFITNL